MTQPHQFKNSIWIRLLMILFFIIIVGICYTVFNFNWTKTNQTSTRTSTLHDNQSNSELIPYTGKVEHIFFHPVIAYPNRAFIGDYQEQAMNDWFVTVKEFNKVIQSIYEKQFILINIQEQFEQRKVNGKLQIVQKPLMLPRNKKPLVISIDDTNYYPYMIKYGIVEKLILDPFGNIAALSTNNGEGTISYDNDIVPLLDAFVSKHPDFSHQGAKATLALTGFEGILGYRTNHNNPGHIIEEEAVKPVIKRLKETGWNFASHSYGHPNHLNLSLEQIERDSTKWHAEVGSLIGDTPIYIYPYGLAYAYRDPRLQSLQKMGYQVFCSVGSYSYEEPHSDAMLIDRRCVDGKTLRNKRNDFLDLYDAQYILDLQARPAIK
ncbi:polysaccharide deacetylase family protein [Paenibacillus sp. N1-5-1-14]|uniref:polysaccharide deacetylase family protein n=1 Tax=Paenibacillus radicibacter TaxID=2972488 RepID=UPI002158BD2D|nr:polysaccharide deacetylase family protein [Paenibacillus radicibacter]MCR8645797.1 polysaccharide deacetylase family protein [Paenibacillus radicibacter]